MSKTHGLKIWDLCIEIILTLSEGQAEKLYSYLIATYTRRSKVKLYNEKGELDTEGVIRLMPSQYQSIRTKYGDSYIKKAFLELTNYILYLQKNMDSRAEFKQKFKKLQTGSHMMLLGHPDGWVYQKCKNYIIFNKPEIVLNPFMIDDFNTAKKYIESIPREFRKEDMTVQGLLEKFPELNIFE